jgi:tryptophan 2,3-dioxygenase
VGQRTEHERELTSAPMIRGVGGQSRHAADRASELRLLERAARSLARWRDTPDRTSALHRFPEAFPFDDLLAYYRCTGRINADTSLVAAVRAVRDSSDSQSLTAWLAMLVDQENGDYGTYYGGELFEQYRHRSADRRSGYDPNDTLIAALIADLAALEAEALAATADDGEQRKRTRATVQALAGLPRLAPGWQRDALPCAEINLPSPLPAELDDHKLAELAVEAAVRINDGMPADVRHLVEISLAPVTRLHDEQMFIRLIQVFEVLYTIVGDCLANATDTLRRGDANATCVALGTAATRLRAMSVLFRVLTTMPSDAFSVIRSNTPGRSANQSASYRRVERLSAPPAPAAEGDTGGASLQGVWQRQATRLSDQESRQVADAMLALDANWRTTKRTHWGITLKTIGRAPGTGGTSGADYLQAKADTPLFPLLRASQRREGTRANG